MKRNDYINTFLSILVSLVVGGIVVALMGFNPLETYKQLFVGAFAGKFNFGGTLEKFVPLMLTGIAFAVSSQVAVFNVGVEGELYLGAIAAAWAGFAIKGLPAFVHIPLCLAIAMAVGALWGAIPGSLKAYFGVNEVCVTILLNYVAQYLASFLVNYPLSAHGGTPQTPQIAASATLKQIMLPSRANTGLFIAIVAVIIIYWIVFHTTYGYKMRSVGTNFHYTEYIGIDAKKTMVSGMMLSGAIGGLAGAIEVMGIYGYFLDSFSNGIAFDGMLAALIAKNNFILTPILAMFLAVLKSGALSMERFTGVPKSLVDAIIATFILLATMEGLFTIRKRKKAAKTNNTKIEA